MKTLNTCIIVLTAAVVCIVAAYILDVSLRSPYSNINLIESARGSQNASALRGWFCSVTHRACSAKSEKYESITF